MNSLTLTVELLLFGFRIYVERVGESSDVRPAGRAAPYVPAPAEPPAGLWITEPVHYTAYDRCDDRTFPDPADVGTMVPQPPS